MSPRKLYDTDENGKLVEIEVPTAEELEAQISQKVGETKAEYDNRIKEMEADLNPNIRELRQGFNAAKKKIEALEAQGKTLDDNGNVIDKEIKYNPEDIDRKINESIAKSTFTTEKQRLLGRFGDKKDLVEHYLNKLLTGEDQTVENLYKFAGEAEQLANPGGSDRIPSSVTSRPPVDTFNEYGQKADDFADNPAGKDFGSQMGLVYSKIKK